MKCFSANSLFELSDVKNYSKFKGCEYLSIVVVNSHTELVVIDCIDDGVDDIVFMNWKNGMLFPLVYIGSGCHDIYEGKNVSGVLGRFDLDSVVFKMNCVNFSAHYQERYKLCQIAFSIIS